MSGSQYETLRRVDIDETFYLLIGPELRPGPRGYSSDADIRQRRAWRISATDPALPHDAPVSKVSVMSKHTGEVRGYFLCRGQLYLTLPNYGGAWPELEASVSRVLQAAIAR